MFLNPRGTVGGDVGYMLDYHKRFADFMSRKRYHELGFTDCTPKEAAIVQPEWMEYKYDWESVERLSKWIGGEVDRKRWVFDDGAGEGLGIDERDYMD